MAAALLLPPAAVADATDDGIKAFTAGDFPAAVKYFAVAVEAHPKEAVLYAWLGSAQLRAGRNEAAVETLTKGIGLDPKMPEAQNNLGSAYWALKDVAKAIEHYQQAVELQPRYAAPHYNLGTALVQIPGRQHLGQRQTAAGTRHQAHVGGAARIRIVEQANVLDRDAE